MNKDQNNTQRMIKVVLSLCIENLATVNTNAPFLAAMNELSALSEDIDVIHTKQTANNKGVTATKKHLQLELVNTGLGISGALFAYATRNNNQTLQEKMKFSRSKLTSGPQARFISYVTSILNEAKAHVAHFEEIALSENQLNHFEEKINEYKRIYSMPREVAVNETKETKNLAAKIEQAKEILKNQMDKLALQFKVSSPTFFSAYQQARKIEDRGNHLPKKGNDSPAQ